MEYHQCRRKFSIAVNDTRDVVKNVIVLDPQRNIEMFEECKDCGYGAKAMILKSREAPFEYTEIKSCMFRRVK